MNEEHARALADSGREFEPILVHRALGRVVDGMHRMRASALRGRREIAVRYVDGTPDEMFIRSVESNVNHGLPLTLRERKAAVVRILASHAHWSDRAIATVTGVSPKTVGAARKRLPTEENPQSEASAGRLGRDGRVRPVNMAERRDRALALLVERPGVTLREVAREAEVSISTAHRLRQELRSQAAMPVPETRRPASGEGDAGGAPSPLAELIVAASRRGIPAVPTGRDGAPGPAGQSRIRALETLSNDPSIRFTDSGRALLRWLNGQDRVLAAGEQLLSTVPPHCAQALAEVASHYARAWERFAVELGGSKRVDGPLRAVR
ncbi:ParB/RepB/Spo0J family partition protein [Streptomyces chisholmiae]